MPISFLHLSPFMPSGAKAKLCQFLQMPTVFEDINCVTPPQYKQCWKTSKWFHDGTKNIFFFSLDIFNNYTLIFLVLTINTQLVAVYFFI